MRRDEEAHARAAARAGARLPRRLLAERGGERERVEVDAGRCEAELRVVAAAEAGGQLDDPGPVRPEHDLRVGRARR